MAAFRRSLQIFQQMMFVQQVRICSRYVLQGKPNMLRPNLSKVKCLLPTQTLHFYCTITDADADVDVEDIEETPESLQLTETERNPDPKDRSRQVSVETSIKYLNSKAYKDTYGDDPVWKNYRRNFKGQFQPKRTRKTCIRAQRISSGNPCPICRDEFLVLDYKNVKLLKQFISPHTGETLKVLKTGICMKQHTRLLISIEKAKDYGYIEYTVPFREYDYAEFYPGLHHKAEVS